MAESDTQIQARLGREARETRLGRLGDRSGVNVAKVEVSWYVEYEDWSTEEHAGHYLVHATGDEPEAAGEEGSIYIVVEKLVHDAMQAKVDAGQIDGYAIDDIYSY